MLFSASLTQGTIPEEWRHAIITPVYKGNNKHQSKAESYRPISLKSVTCKLMEHIIHSHIMKYLDKDQTLSLSLSLSETQHGFRKFHSSETQLLEIINNISSSLNNCEQIDSIILDFSKEFDKVCHRKLLLKLDYYGIKGNTHKWISNFLQNQTQHLVVCRTFSENVSLIRCPPRHSPRSLIILVIYKWYATSS